jgi:thioesterase domain-containing protein
VEEAAECYVNEIMKLHPHGPYNLVGGCFGGLVVFEMARRLRLLGEPVGVVALIDTRNLNYGRSLPVAKLLIVNLRYLLLRCFHHLKILAKMKKQERSRYLLERINLFRQFSRNLILFSTGKKGAWKQTKNQAVAIEFGEGMKDLGDVLNRVRAASLEAAYSYIPEPFDGHVHVFRAKNRKEDPYRDETLGWRSVAKGGVTAYAIDGDHLSIFRHPDVAEVAQKLNAALIGAQRENQG